jgi:hypothetical protein
MVFKKIGNHLRVPERGLKSGKMDQENQIPCPPAPKKDIELFYNGFVWVQIDKHCYNFVKKNLFGNTNR